ncbi:hypothetical protein LINGRAHAP2_LOCUS4995, partial [Linum grandiflorum]
ICIALEVSFQTEVVATLARQGYPSFGSSFTFNPDSRPEGLRREGPKGIAYRRQTTRSPSVLSRNRNEPPRNFGHIGLFLALFGPSSQILF